MYCSPCGSGSNYSSASTINTVSIQGNLYDAFSRLAVATPTTTFTSHPAYTPELYQIGFVSTGVASVYLDISDTLILLSTGGAGGRAVRQSLEYLLYEPGKAHQVMLTWVPQYSGTFDDSVASRCGIYDDYRDKNTPAGITGPPPYIYQSSINGGTGVETNQPSMGHFFELSGNSWFVVERRNSPNNITNVERVAQSNWNIDTLNSNYGNNPSGVQLQKNVEGLYWIERQWLGIGVVNMGIYSSGSPIVCHQFKNRGLKQPYTHLNKLPMRYEIEKVSGGSSNSAVSATICMSSQIDGTYTPIGGTFSLPADIVINTTRVSTTLKPVLLIRLKQQYCRASIKVKNVEFYGAAAGVYSLFKNPTITGTITWVNHPDPRSMAQYAIFANGTTIPSNTISGGQCIQSGFFDVRTTQSVSQIPEEILAAPPISSDIAGNPDVFCISMAGFSANDDVTTNCTWLEII